MLFILTLARLLTDSCNIFIDKLMKCRLAKRTMKWTEN